MKKIIKTLKFLLAFSLIFNFQSLSATNTFFNKNKTYSGQIKFKGISYKLPEGDWEVANKYDWHIMGIQGDGVTLVLIEDNTIKSLMEFMVIEPVVKYNNMVKW